MSQIESALNRLNQVVEALDSSMAAGVTPPQPTENVIDVDFVAMRLDKAIATVETLLMEGQE